MCSRETEAAFPWTYRAPTPSPRELQLLGKRKHTRFISSPAPGTLPFSPLPPWKRPNLVPQGSQKPATKSAPFALPSQENAAQLPYSRVIGYDSCISLDRIKKKKKEIGKKRKTLPASEITRKVTFLLLTHTKRAQPLISADHMLPLLLARS